MIHYALPKTRQENRRGVVVIDVDSIIQQNRHFGNLSLDAMRIDQPLS